MNKLFKLAFVVCLWSFLQTMPVRACRYNVREVGFVDLGIEPYYFYGYVSKDTPAEIVSRFKQISHAALMDSNIEVEIVDTDQQKDHPAMKYLDSWSIQSFPAAVLVSPDGQSLPVSVAESDRPFKETLWSALDGIVSSPKREEILQQVCKTYGAVLLIEGPDTQENRRAKEAVAAAIEQVSSQMEWLPKPIDHPPVLVVLDSNLLSQEKILLWSLGLEAEEINKPHAAVLYGRGRWIGPMFVGEQITEDNLAAVLFVIGGDCECGLDQRWLQGTMLPAKWSEKLQALAAETLEFDPESPMIKMEMSWIVRRGYSYYPRGPLDYRELAVGAEPVSDTQPASGGLVVQAPNAALPATPNVVSPSASALASEQSSLAEADDRASLKRPLYFIAGLAVLIIAVGLLIVLRQAGKNV